MLAGFSRKEQNILQKSVKIEEKWEKERNAHVLPRDILCNFILYKARVKEEL